MQPIVVALSGASGAIYAVRLIDVLLAAGCDVDLSISPAGATVLKQELDLTVDLEDFRLADLLPPRDAPSGARLRRLLGTQTKMSVPRGTLAYHHYRNLMSRIASGSSRTGGMVVCPCSGGTLSAIAQGASTNLIHRAADVHLKERRTLILVPRETPLSLVYLENMRRCVEAGAVVLPAMPGWYHGVDSIRDLVDFVVARICDQLGVEADLIRRWGEKPQPGEPQP